MEKLKNIFIRRIILVILFIQILPPSWGEAFPGEGLDLQLYLPPPLAAITRTELKRAEQLTHYIRQQYPFNRGININQIVNAAIKNANKHDLDAELILAIIAVESTYNPKAVSIVGARGLMQVMPNVHADKLGKIGGEDALFEMDKNIHVGATIFAEYLRRDKGDVTKALLRYNGSYADKTQKYAKKVLTIYAGLKAINMTTEPSKFIKRY